MVFEYLHKVSLFEIGSYLDRYLDDHSTVPKSPTPLTYPLEAHLNFLLCADMTHGRTLQKTLDRYLPALAAETLYDIVHDQLLLDVRPYMTLEDNESVIEVRVHRNYDATIVVHEYDGAHAAAL